MIRESRFLALGSRFPPVLRLADDNMAGKDAHARRKEPRGPHPAHLVADGSSCRRETTLTCRGGYFKSQFRQDLLHLGQKSTNGSKYGPICESSKVHSATVGPTGSRSALSGFVALDANHRSVCSTNFPLHTGDRWSAAPARRRRASPRAWVSLEALGAVRRDGARRRGLGLYDAQGPEVAHAAHRAQPQVDDVCFPPHPSLALLLDSPLRPVSLFSDALP